MRRLRALLVASLTVALLLPPGVAAAQEEGPPPGGVPGVALPELAWEPCGVGAECTTALVPFSYADPGGRTLELAVARRPADDQANRIGALFVNFGGPGGSAADIVAEFGEFLFPARVLERFDVIGVDPRGIGASTPVRCWDSNEEQAAFFAGSPPFPVTQQEISDRFRLDRALSRLCGERNGDLLNHTSTTELVRDIDVLRAAVGEEQLNFVGYSYGSYVGSVLANLFPDRARTVVIDGVIDPDDYTNGPPWTINDARIQSDEGAYATLRQFFATCDEAGPACPFSEGDPARKYRELAARLRREPVVLTYPEGEITVTYADMVSQTLGGLYSPLAWPDLAAALQELYDALPGRHNPGVATARLRDLLVEATTALEPEEPEEPYFQGPEGFLSVTCGDTDNPDVERAWSITARLRDATVAPYFGSAWLWGSSPCASWPGRSADRYTGPWNARTLNPVLIIGTRYDPATRYQDALITRRYLPNSSLLTVDGYGHTSVNSTCAFEATADYLLTAVPPPDRTVCPQDFGPFEVPPEVPLSASEAIDTALALTALPAGLVPEE